MEIIHQSAYYVIGKFVDGYTSIVWHALNSEGEEVAIKMYEKNFDDRYNILSDDEFRETAKAATKLETERLKKFYNVLDGKVHNLELSGFSCVVMPLFTPVKSCERADVLDDVEKVLRTFIQAGFQYDTRWRHVEIYHDDSGKKHYILYDLADLEEVDDLSDETLVQTKMKDLRGRIRYEQERISNLNRAVLISDN
eukprot:217955_1